MFTPRYLKLLTLYIYLYMPIYTVYIYIYIYMGVYKYNMGGWGGGLTDVTSYTNSAVNGQMNACMPVQSFPIMFGLCFDAFVTLSKVIWLWFGK